MTKNVTCVYDVAEDGKTTTQLRAHVRRLVRELDDVKSIIPLFATAPDRSSAVNWANELEKNGFNNYSVEEMKMALQVGGYFARCSFTWTVLTLSREWVNILPK